MSKDVLSKPLDIGAPDLLRAVPFTHSGTLHVQVKRLLGKKKWQSRYVVISQGCLYIYEDKNAKHKENAYAIKHFESVKECDADSDESFCFCIKYEIPTKKPLIFDSDTYNSRMVWMNELDKAIQTVQHFSSDSGFGSGGTFFPRDREYASGGSYKFQSRDSILPGEIQDEVDQKGYDEILDWHIKTAGTQPVQESIDTLNTFSNSSSMLSVRLGSIAQSASGTEHTRDKVVYTRDDSGKRLNKQDKDDAVYANTGPSTLSLLSLKEGIENECAYINTENTRESDNKRVVESLSSTTPSLLSVSGPTENVDEEESDNTSSDSDTMPKTVYESPEEDVDAIYANAQLFETADYYCESKKNGRRKLQAKVNGTFLVCPGETTMQVLCVKTSNGDISFHIYEQNGKVSLFKSFSMESYVFPTLDALLRYYHIYELPSKNSRVKLERGLNSRT